MESGQTAESQNPQEANIIHENMTIKDVSERDNFREKIDK